MTIHESIRNNKRQKGFTGDQLRIRLRQYDRGPFLDLLALMLECAPTEADLQRLARSHPDRYINAIGQLARTGGFTDKTEVNHNVNVSVTQMSDSQIEDRIKQLAEQMALPAPPTIDAEYEPVDPDDFDSEPTL